MSPDDYASTVLFWITVAIVCAMGVAWAVRWLVRLYVAHIERTTPPEAPWANAAEEAERVLSSPHRPMRRTRRPSFVRVLNARSRLPNQRSIDVQRSAFSVQGDDLLLPNSPDELYRLVAAIRHKDKGATKQQAIEVAWGIRKGGSAAWRRASALFDAATSEPPTRYPQRTPAQEAAREELGLEVKR